MIDLSGKTSSVVDEVGRACREIGFLTVVGHGVPDELVERTASIARGFFDLPGEEKLDVAQGDQQLGLPVYRPLRSESLAASLGQRTPGDLKESLDWGPAVPGYGWPPRPPGLRDAFQAYLAALGGLGERLRRLFALALELPEDWFESAFRDHSSSMRVINYPRPEGEIEPGQLRAGAHTDYGCMTILRTEDAPGGLQVQTPAGEWLDVHAVPGSFVVNLGDMMARLDERPLAGDAASCCRPAGRPARRQPPPDDRLLPRPACDAVIECIPSCTDAGNPPRYEPVTALEHVNAKAAKAHAV